MLSEIPDTGAACSIWRNAIPDIPAARSALRVLGYLSRRSGPVRASTLARDLGLPRSSVYQLIAVMIDEGFVVHYPADHAYGLSTMLSEIGTSSLRTARLGRLAQPLLDRLVAECRIPVVAHLSVLSGADVMYVSRAQGFRAPTTVSAIGVRLPAHLTATGRAMLAQLSAAQVRALFPHRDSLISRHGVGPRTLGELDGILGEGRARGWSREDGEITREYASVGAAALDRNGYPVAAVGVTFRSVAAEESDLGALGDRVHATAAALTARL